MKDSGSLIFPFNYDNENNCLLRAFTIEETVISAIKSFIVTRKGSRLGSNIGSFVPELLFTNINSSTLPGLSLELSRELSNQFPGVSFINTDIIREVTENSSGLKIKIKLSISGKVVDFDMSLPSIYNNANI